MTYDLRLRCMVTASGLRLFTLAWIVVPVSSVVWLVVRDLVPSGTLVVRQHWRTASPYLAAPVPETRVVGPLTAGADTFFQLSGQPVYLDVRNPRPFTRAEVTLRFDPGQISFMELGIAADRQAQTVELAPLYHRTLEVISRDPAWSVVRDQHLTLYQRGNWYPSIAAFLRQPPSPGQLATYRVPQPLPMASTPLPAAGAGSGSNFILTGYQAPGTDGEWRVAKLTFPLSAALMRNDPVRLVISVPEGVPFAGPPRIADVTVTFRGEALNGSVLSGWISRWFPSRRQR